MGFSIHTSNSNKARRVRVLRPLVVSLMAAYAARTRSRVENFATIWRGLVCERGYAISQMNKYILLCVYIPAPPKRCQYDPKGWLMGTLYHSFSTPLVFQVMHII